MILSSKRKHIINKAIEKTLLSVSDRTPKIYQHFFYGAFDIGPQNLVIWYLFETNTELETAKSSGYCDELQELTIRNLISFGYPQEAFEPAQADSSIDKITIQGFAEQNKLPLFSILTNRTAMISFSTKEDIDKKANGDYYLYFH